MSRSGGLTIAAVGLMFFGASLVNDHRAPAAPAPRPQPITVQAASTSTYVPQSRDVLITTVPLLVHEQVSTFDWLKQDFRKGGVFDGTEVWGFYPSTVTVYAGDTVNLTVVNPSDDPHTFTAPDLGFNLDVGTQTQATGSFVTPKPGVYRFECTVSEHMPFMYGTIVVLPGSDAPTS